MPQAPILEEVYLLTELNLVKLQEGVCIFLVFAGTDKSKPEIEFRLSPENTEPFIPFLESTNEEDWESVLMMLQEGWTNALTAKGLDMKMEYHKAVGKKRATLALRQCYTA